MRADGIPTYNFGVVLDDLDMGISHVIRGDDHVNNTPRQINILMALGGSLPQYAHVPMILGTDGERLSKRHSAVSVMQYQDEGYLPEALINYLARLGWSHGNEELFSREQLIEWFDLESINCSPARFNLEKLQWINQHYLKISNDAHLMQLVTPLLEKRGCNVINGPDLKKIVNIIKERVSTIMQLADESSYFFVYQQPSDELKTQYLGIETKALTEDLKKIFAVTEWNRQAIHDAIKVIASAHNIKLPKVAMPLRVMITGRTQTPSIDSVLELIGKEEVLKRINFQV